MKATLNYLDKDKDKPIIKVGIGDFVSARKTDFNLTKDRLYKVKNIYNEGIIYVRNDAGAVVDYPVELFHCKEINKELYECNDCGKVITEEEMIFCKLCGNVFICEECSENQDGYCDSCYYNGRI